MRPRTQRGGPSPLGWVRSTPDPDRPAGQTAVFVGGVHGALSLTGILSGFHSEMEGRIRVL